MKHKRHPKTRRSQRRFGIIGKVLVGVLIALGVAATAFLTRRTSDDAIEAASLGDVIDSASAAGYNVLLVTLDTVRWDHIGCYGSENARTPEINALTKRGVRFEQAIAPAPLTLPSHATVLTGLNPPRHGARDNGRYRVEERHETLAETFRAHGYDTAAFVACFVLDARFGLDQGFDVYDFEVDPAGYQRQMPDFNERSAGAVTDAALKWLRKRVGRQTRDPFFLWVHYFDAHLPYRSPYQHDPQFAGRPYDAEISYIDQEFGRLHRALRNAGLSDRTLIVMTADHGEALGEHGEPTHGMLLYDCTVRVPLIFSCPTLFSCGYHVTGQMAGLVDLRRTLEDLVGLPNNAESDGTSLLESTDPGGRTVYCETEAPRALYGWSPLFGVRSPSSKFVQGPDPEYYDLTTDPREERNLYSQNPAGMSDLVAELDSLTMIYATYSGGTRDLTDDEIRRFAALGYVQAGSRLESDSLADPKSMMSTMRDANRSEQLYGQGRYTEAASLAQSVLSLSPGSIQARRVLAMSCLKMGEAERAVAVLESVTKENPDPFLVRSLAQVLIMEKRFDQAWNVLDLYETIDPEDGRHFLMRGDIKADAGSFEEALEYYGRAAEVDPKRTGFMAQERIQRVQRTTGDRSDGGS